MILFVIMVLYVRKVPKVLFVFLLPPSVFCKLGGASWRQEPLWWHLPKNGHGPRRFCQRHRSKRNLHALRASSKPPGIYLVLLSSAFVHTGCFQNVLFLPLPVWPHTWLLFTSFRALADTRQMGKLTREQFSLAMHLIQLKVSKGLDPPQALTPDMIPPSERGTPGPVS